MSIRPLASAPVRFDLPRPTKRRGLQDVLLRPGVIDDDVFEVFAYGYCYLLACALHEVSGWPFGFIDIDDPNSGGWRWAHVGVLAPDGRFVDVAGPLDVSGQLRLIDRHGISRPARVRQAEDFDEFRRAVGARSPTPADFWDECLVCPVQVEVVRSFADVLVRAVEC